ncbi:endonuclease/exonuclease/phosphatase family protein [Agromyces sp. NPDC058110]|uniref:endonuclease/exonuclease/phosphatase family protein n=1 Tax=Agromyces sp. NPDC058110 TaxID=3346345 RepID=UPI0036DF45C9
MATPSVRYVERRFAIESASRGLTGCAPSHTDTAGRCPGSLKSSLRPSGEVGFRTPPRLPMLRSVRLMTWNVLWRFEPDWRARERAILSTLNQLKPDVIGLQECWYADGRSQAHVFAERLGMHAAFEAPSLPPVPDPPEHPDQAGALMGVGIVSRWPITAVRRHELPVSHRQVAPVALGAELRHPDTPFRVIVAATEWEPDYADDHLAQTAAIAELVAHPTPGPGGDIPTFLLADLNCDSSQAEFAPLAAVADDTWELGHGDPDAATLSSVVPFAPFEATKEIDRRIDHILVTRSLDVAIEAAFTVDSPVGDLYPSDHFPVVADVRLTRELRPS